MIPYSLPSAFSVYSLLARLAPAEVSAPQRVAVAVRPTAPVMGETLITPTARSTSAPVDWLAILWLAGALVCGLFFAVSYLKCRREFAQSLPADHPALETWLAANPIRRSVSIRVCDRISTPLTYGVLHPVILLPKTIPWADTQSLDYVLTHELVHIRRFDAVTKLVLAATACLHWFNPAVWVMVVLVNRDLELTCDEAVLRRFGPDSRKLYAAALLSLEETRGGVTLYNHFGKNALEERIVSIMKTGKTTLTALILAAVLIFTVTAALATSSKPQETEPPVGSLLNNPDKPTTEVKVITSYVDRMDGKTYYSDDNGQTWHEGDAFLQTGYDFDSVDWWTAEEYEAYLEQMKTEFQSMIGERSWNPTEGWYTWDQARVDAAIAGNEQLLQEIRDGKLVSKPTADGDTMIQFSYDPRAIGHLTEASGAVAHASVESPSQEEILAEYAPFGITFDGSTMRYHGELVDVFVDGVELDSGGWALRYSHTDYRNGLRLVTVRSRKDNGDGSFDPFGVLTGIRALQDEELKGLGLSRYAAPAQEATALTTDSASEDGGVDFRDAFNAKFKPYGVSFVPSGTFGNIYWNGKLVHVFVDDMPDGTYQTISSIDGGTVSLKAVYDASGNLNGVVETAEGVSLS